VASNRGGVGTEKGLARFQTTAGRFRQRGRAVRCAKGPGADRIGCGFLKFNYEANPRGRNPTYEVAK
jgi:hypothetical protein